MRNDILITGATGGLGQTAVDYALSQGSHVAATGRSAFKLEQLAQRGASTYAADLRTVPDKILIKLADMRSAVWHCAGLATPWASKEDYHDVNVLVAERMFMAAARAGVPTFVHVSSPSLYFDFSNQKDIPESFAASVYASEYAVSKAQAELRLQALALQYPGTRLVMLRPRALYGPYDQVLFPRVMRLAQAAHGNLWLPNGGSAFVDLCYLENAAHAMWLASHAKVQSGSVFNITDEHPVTVRDAMTQFFRELGRAVALHGVPYPLMAGLASMAEKWAKVSGNEPVLTRHSLAALAFDSTLDTTAASEQLGYQPLVSFHEGLRKTAQALR